MLVSCLQGASKQLSVTVIPAELAPEALPVEDESLKSEQLGRMANSNVNAIAFAKARNAEPT